MYSTNTYESSRQIPVRYETDLWRPRWELPREFPRWEMSRFNSPTFSTPPPSVLTPAPAPLPPPDFSSSLVHYPDMGRQMGHFDQELRRMNDEMSKMFGNMQKLTPVGNVGSVGSVDDWRLTENFRLDNPIVTERDGSRRFRLQFDVRQFKPEEITVRTAGNTLSVHAKHDSKDSGKAVFREYQRQYVVPKEVNQEMLSSKLSTDGVLTIEAPLPALEGPREKMIPIEHKK